MSSRFALQILVALQLLAALVWPLNVSAGENAQHTAFHAVLALHHHDDAIAHHEDHEHGHERVEQLSEPNTPAQFSNEAGAEHHHHHDLNVNIALLPARSQLTARGLAIQNPRTLPAILTAERRLHLRPPQA